VDAEGDMRTDFEPDETVYVHGSGFSASMQIDIGITRPDLIVFQGSTFSDNIGGFVYPYLLDGITGTYAVTATDGTNTAATKFTDAKKIKTYKDPACTILETVFYQGETVYAKATSLEADKYYKFVWVDPSGDIVKEMVYENGATSRTDNYPLPSDASIGKWRVKIFRGTSSGGPWSHKRAAKFKVRPSITPIADSWVELTKPDTNKGSHPILRVRVDWDKHHEVRNLKRSYLKFDLSGLPPGVMITSAKLHLRRESGNGVPSVYRTADNWTENGITWNNQPGPGALENDCGVVSGRWIEWGITSYAASEYAGDKVLSVVLKFKMESGSDQRADFPSRERKWDRRPWLEISYVSIVPQWQVLKTWTGTVNAPAAWSLIEMWTGTVTAPAEWQLIETWTGTVSTPVQWQVIETWMGTVSAPVEWNLIETWTGTITIPAAWQLVETWTGTVSAPAVWQTIESWAGTVSPPAEWQVIVTWTGTVSAPAVWQLIQTWAGTLEALTLWSVVETWTGAVSAPVAWRVVETWMGTVAAPAPAWQAIETWTGTVNAPVKWQLIETWTGTVQAPTAWKLIESWTGTVSALAEWHLIGTWTGTVSVPATWQLIETWTGAIEAPAPAWQLIESWMGTVTTLAPPGKPALYSPANGTHTNDNTPTFEWTLGSNADNHRLLVDNDADFTSPVENRLFGPTENTYSPALENSLPDDNYSWKVIAINALGENHSSVWTFVIDTVPPVAPSLASPVNGAVTTDNTPTFDWSDVAGAENYDLLVDDDADFSSPEIQVTVSVSTHTPTTELPNDNYFWKVRARDAANNISDWSTPWTLFIGIARSVDVSISPEHQSGLPGETLSYTVTIKNEGNVSDTYTLTVTDTAGWDPTLSKDSLSLASMASGAATLTIAIPPDASAGAQNTVTITAISTEDPTVGDSATITAQASALRRVEVSVSPESKGGAPGENITFTITVTNEGNIEDTYILTASGAPGWSVNIEPNSLTLAVGARGEATLSVVVPTDADEGDSITVTVSARSETDPNVVGADTCRAIVTGVVDLAIPLLISALLIGAGMLVAALMLRGRWKKTARRRVLRDVGPDPPGEKRRVNVGLNWTLDR
jgi:hypothetical protein